MTSPENPSYFEIVDHPLPADFVGLHVTIGTLIDILSKGHADDVGKVARKLAEASEALEQMAEAAAMEPPVGSPSID